MASRAITWTFFCMRFGSLPCINAAAVAAAGHTMLVAAVEVKSSTEEKTPSGLNSYG
jgi:hypothetical protein